MPLELTVTQEQVKSFLRDGFVPYMEDSQRERPTGGVDNYAGHILGIAQQVRSSTWMCFPDDLRTYLDRFTLTVAKFERSLLGVIGSNPNIDREEYTNDHYSSLTALPELYNDCLLLAEKHKEVDWLLGNIGIETLRQVTIINTLFDPEKRDWRFQRLIWGEPEEFTSYIDEILENNN